MTGVPPAERPGDPPRLSLPRWLLVPLAVWAVVVLVAVATVAHLVESARADQRALFRLRTTIAAAQLAAYVESLESQLGARGEAMLAAPQPTAGDLQTTIAGLGLTAGGLFDDHSRLLVGLPYNSALVGRTFGDLVHVVGPLRTGRPGVSQVVVSPALREPVLGVGVPFQTPSGRRVVTGVFSVQHGAPAAQVQATMSLSTTAVYLLDAGRHVAAATRPTDKRVATLARFEPALDRAWSRRRAGSVRIGGVSREFASAPVDSTGWTLVTTVTSATLFESVHAGLLWARVLVIVVAAIGLATAVSYGIATRRRREAEERLRQANHRLEEAVRVRTADLAAAVAKLQAANERLERRRTSAMELNDHVLQRLVVAQGALSLGDADVAAQALNAGLASIRDVVDRLLPADVQPGALRHGDRGEQ